MIISPPFLPARGSNDTDDQWVDAAMPMDAPAQGVPSGVFPVSRNLGWHGGVHLVAPTANGAALPVRAIADGQVIFARQPTAATTNPTDALNYNPDAPGPSRTDDGCVVIVHETEIGADAANVATSLRYYSVYMHLSTVTCATQMVGGQAQPRPTPFAIHRKDEIGAAGSIYGQPNRIHFEIVFDDVALASLLGRPLNASPGPDAQGRPRSRTLDLASNANGRLDAVFGEIYFRLPQTTTFHGTRPAANVVAPATPGTTPLTADLIVGMRFAAGQGVVADRGDITWTSYQLDGTAIGAPLSENEGEYDLYTNATAIVQTYRQANQAAPAPPPPRPPVPNASAVYELLRFGRIVDTAHETLNPADVPIWKEVRHAGGQGWVNLRAPGVHVYSDADLPQWKGWKILDSDPNPDSRCDSQEIRAILDQDGNGTVTPTEANNRIGDAAVRGRLAKQICRMPTEWDAAAIDIRWGWLMQTSPENPTPLGNADFTLFRNHVQALCFWNATAFGLPTTHWHMHPVEFIKHFRKCDWVGISELIQTFPRYHFYERNAADQYVAHTQGAAALYQISKTQATTRISPYHKSICRVIRKYSFSNWARKSHLLCQLLLETDRWRAMREYGKGQTNPNIPKAQYYAAFYGRGAIQTTWAGNYEKYGNYRGFPNHAAAYGDSLGRITATSTHYWEDPVNNAGVVVGTPRVWSPRFDPEILADNDYAAIDSAGFYFVSRSIGGGLDNFLRKCDEDFTPTTVGRLNVLVNGGGNGYHERQAYARFIRLIFDDQFDSSATDTVATPKKTVIVNLARGV